MKKLGWTVAAAIVLIAGAFAAMVAGKPEQAWTGLPEVRTEPAILKFMFWGNRTQSEMYAAMFEEFSRLHPGVVVELESVPFPEYQQKISILAAGRELPDIAWAADRMVPQFLDNGILADITDVTRSDAFGAEDFMPSTLDLFRHVGRLYGLPFSVPPSVVFYNADLFRGAGLASPNELYREGKWTWEAFRETARAIAADKGASRVYGANFLRDWKTWIQLSSFSWSNGSGPFNADMSAFAWDDEQGIRTMEMLSDMILREKSHPPLGEQVDFDSGRVGMYFDVYSYVSVARQIGDFEWSIAPLPSGTNGPVPMLGQAGYVVFRDSRHPELARELLAFLTGAEGIRKTSAYFVPPRQSVLNSAGFLKDEGSPPPEDIRTAVIDQMKNARFQPGHVNWQQIDNRISEGLDRLVGGELTPEETVRWMADRVNPLLGQRG